MHYVQDGANRQLLKVKVENYKLQTHNFSKKFTKTKQNLITFANLDKYVIRQYYISSRHI